MALYKTSLGIFVRNSRLLSAIAPRVKESWFQRIKNVPVLSALEKTSKLSDEQWTKLRKDMLETKTLIKPNAQDVLIMKLCIVWHNLELGKSYLEYLQRNIGDLSIATVGKYFHLFHTCRDALTDLDKTEMLHMYDNLRLKHPLLDAITAECCISAICLTERWKEAVELLEMIKISGTPSVAAYSVLIAAAFDHEDRETGWKYLHEMAEQKRIPQSPAYIAYINYCSRNFKKPDTCVEEIGKLFNLLAEHDLMLENIVVEKIKTIFQTFGWVGAFAKLSNKGVCLNCNHELPPLELSKEDFSHLSKTILDKVIVGNNIYYKSTPGEVKKFTNFVHKTKPYDIVIDGLNVAFKHKKYSSVVPAEQLASVVRYFVDQNQTVLVLGRKHMLRWNERCIRYIKNNSFLFLTDDLSSDDPCLLYATLASGPETKFVSSDLMRQHKHILGDVALQRTFKRWQMNHQIFVTFYKTKLQVIPPLNYLPAAQGDKNCWHIPFTISTSHLTDSYEPPTDWLCLNRVKSRCK